MKDVIVTGYSNLTKEGVVIHTNVKSLFKRGSGLKTKEHYVSWDKIGMALFENYTDLESVEDRNKLRNEAHS